MRNKFFFKREYAESLVLLACVVIAMCIVNSGFAKNYYNLLHLNITIGYGKFSLSMSLLHWINDGLMSVFFLVVGMGIKKEMAIGELSSIKRTILPIFAAIGGMVVPVIIYSLFNYGRTTIAGWGIPMATDIAFAFGIITVAAKSAPRAIVVFLTALAIVDDLGAVIVIAIFYSDKISWMALISGMIIFFILIILNRFKVQMKSLFVIGGIILWICLLKSGIHATIAGVLLGMAVPIGKNRKEFKTSMLYEFERILTPWSNFLVMPTFALANSGIIININDFPNLISSPVSLGIICGLFMGKPIGIFGISYVLIKSGAAELPYRVTKKHLFGASVLGGIGFTMSMFISALSFSDEAILSAAKLSIMLASIPSAALGTVIFKFIK